MQKPNEIMIHISSKCNLKCEPCAYRFLDIDKINKYENDILSLNEFKNIINKVTNFGIVEINITPIIGEPFMIPNFEKYCEYLENNDDVKWFTFFTNLTHNFNINKFLSFKKLRIVISINGLTYNMFNKNTHGNKNEFEIFSNNLLNILNIYNNKMCKLEFFIRDDIKNTNKKFELLLKYLSEMFDISNPWKDRNGITHFKKNGNWCGLIPDDIITNNTDFYIQRMKMDGICKYALNENCILPDGNIILCGATDPLQQTYIGNVNDLNDTYKKWNNILRDMKNNKYPKCCSRCSEFHK